jgi:hypothetical protein
MYRFVLLVASAVVILFSSLSGKVLQVPGQYSTIQAGINSASRGDTVLVAPGTYFENIKFRGKRIVVGSRFLLDNNLNWVRTTIIDGGHPLYPDSASVVLFKSTEDSTTVLAGFTITNGVGTLVPGSFLGGGVLVTGGSAPTIRFNIIRNNNAVIGGGIAVRQGFPAVVHNAIVNNSAGDGGGIWMEGGQVVIRNNVFLQNFADNRGGALAIKSASVSFLNNSVTANYASQGGGIFCDNGFWEIENNNFYQNAGGHFVGCGDASLGDATRARNYNLDAADAYLNIYFPPQYVEPAGYNFSLACTSRLIDAGAGPSDIYPQGGSRADIGMVEYPYRVGDINLDGKVNVADATALINIIFLDAPIPCPLYIADADCSRTISIGDAVALIRYWMGLSQTPCLSGP